MCCLPTEKSNARISGCVAPRTGVLHFTRSETYLHVVLPIERPSFRSSHGLKMVRHSRSTITQLNPLICAVAWHQRILSSTWFVCFIITALDCVNGYVGGCGYVAVGLARVRQWLAWS